MFLLISSPVWASPSLTDVTWSGNLTGGTSVSINGTGFSSKSTAAPVKFDDFDSGTNGNSVSTEGYWSTQGTAPVFNNDNLRDGNGLNVQADLNGGTTDAFYKNSAFSTDNIYVNFWVKFNRGSGDDDYQIKLWRLQDTNTAGDYPGISDFNWGDATSGRWSYYQISYDGGGAKTFNHSHYAEDTWINVELQTKVESSAGALDGELHVWQDGVSQVSSTGLKMTNNSQDIGAIRIGSAISNGGTAATQYFDDVYIDDAWNRVLLCNNATYSSRTHCEIQVPSAWSTTDVTVSLNKGTFADDETVWFYVVDSSGNVNNTGWEVTLGGSGEEGGSGGGETQNDVQTTTVSSGGAVVSLGGATFTINQ